MTKRPTAPNAWLALVLRTMSTDELRQEIANPVNSPADVAVLRAELTKRTKGAK